MLFPMIKVCTFTLLTAELRVHCPLLLLLLLLLIIIIIIYSRPLVIRWRSSVKSRSQQQIKAIYPQHYKNALCNAH